ncbi:MAG: 30S ribosomal protein S1 [Candidatus Levybacteria bacterium]|nr:30S ribosomal protein S1 [Candidatus Levybacteria bacterium]
MADLLKSVKTNFVSPHKGDVLEGTVNKLTSGEILIDIGAKSLAVVLEKDKRILKSLLTSLKTGDKVTVSVLNPESDFGNPVVSLRRFNDDRIWVKLESLQKAKEVIEVTVDEITKGGFLVSSSAGISGFLPNSQVSFLDSSIALGKHIPVCVIELSRPLRKIIFSQKATVKNEDFAKLVKGFSRGQKVKATISNIAPFGIFALLALSDSQKIEGFVHISEVSWEKLETVPASFKPGDEIEAEVLGIDREAKRVNLSLKRLTQNPFEQKLKEFTTDKKVTGIVGKVLSSGVIVDLGQGIQGFIKKEKIPPTMSFSQGEVLEATVLEVDRNQRVVLAPVLKEKPIGYR